MAKKVIVDNVVNYLYEIIDYIKNINSIIYSGTASKNHFIISMIQNKLPSNINHYLTIHPALSVVRGTLMFGINPLIKRSRIARFNIGI